MKVEVETGETLPQAKELLGDQKLKGQKGLSMRTSAETMAC
jgi:hypothetical protein